MKRVIVTVGTALVLGQVTFAAVPFDVEGHRGARAARPENTMSAFRYAVEVGADTLEMDLHATKDDVLVITHDPFLNPDLCLDPGGKRIEKPVLVRGLTFQELQRYDCGTLRNPRFKEQVPHPKERIPSFEALLKWLSTSRDPRARRVRLNVETKSEEAHPEYTPAPEPFTRMVLAALKKHGMLERATLQSFDYRTLAAARAMEPRLVRVALVEERPKETLAELASRVKADIVSPDFTWLTAADVQALHAAGVRVIPWTVNDEKDWKRLVEMGVDGIISDDPKGLAAFRAGLAAGR